MIAIERCNAAARKPRLHRTLPHEQKCAIIAAFDVMPGNPSEPGLAERQRCHQGLRGLRDEPRGGIALDGFCASVVQQLRRRGGLEANSAAVRGRAHGGAEFWIWGFHLECAQTLAVGQHERRDVDEPAHALWGSLSH